MLVPDATRGFISSTSFDLRGLSRHSFCRATAYADRLLVREDAKELALRSNGVGSTGFFLKDALRARMAPQS